MFEFLGLLMGCCARTGSRLTLNLPSFIWKPLAGDTVRFDDLYGIDSACCEMIKLIESATADVFEDLAEFFCAKLSD
jgi:hypothetical protein